ncbi:hypothetical protein KAR91_11445 [Candidatus Pacearchaeota archaeon]|nr:hypothetical protein [Candidatus Pacearchaeota archaeon]
MTEYEIRKQEKERLIKLAIDNDIFCSEEDAIKYNCIICKQFWQVLKKEDVILSNQQREEL